MSEETCNEALDLKDVLKDKRDALGLSNQAVADLAGLSIHTVVNYFSNRSKATSAYTVGKLCMALHVSFDRAFDITADDAAESESTQRIHELELENVRRDGEIGRLNAVQEMQTEQAASKRMTHTVLICICIMLTVALAAYIVFDAADYMHGFIRGGSPGTVAIIMISVLAASVLVICWSFIRYVRGK